MELKNKEKVYWCLEEAFAFSSPVLVNLIHHVMAGDCLKSGRFLLN